MLVQAAPQILFLLGVGFLIANLRVGLDTILDRPSFIGGPFSFYVHQGFNLAGTSVNFKQPESLVPDFRSSKTEGQSNFVNPGVMIAGLGSDMDLTPKLKAFTNVNYIWLPETKPIETAAIGNSSIVYGVSVNNSPTVQDLWNSTPAWAYPYITSGLAPGPAAAPMIAGGLAQLVLGATAYAMIDDHLYLEAGAYRGVSDHWLKNLGVGSDANPHMDGMSPYWRAAWQTDVAPHYFSVGLFGMNTKLRPDPSLPDEDRFNDLGFDATYQYVNDSGHAVSADFTVIHEKQSLDASFAAGSSANNDNHLNTVSLDVTYAYQQTWVASTGVFNTSGSTDMGLYAPEAGAGSLSGSPDTRGYIVQLEYVPFGKLDSFGSPWLNVRVGLQYTGYTRFNGSGSNYDGSGRSASDNNTLFGFFWFAL